MTDKTSLGDRMKGYEATQSAVLLRRTPVIIRVDGKAFHTYTKRYRDRYAADPFSGILYRLMSQTAQFMCGEIQNAAFGYTQSDEISILLRDYDTHETQQWFGGKVQKIASVASSLATGYFNWMIGETSNTSDIALFDARVFNVPKEEVTNYFIWRQQDAMRNSVSMLGRHVFSQKAMQGKTTTEVKNMLMTECGKDWDKLEPWKKYGTGIIHESVDIDHPDLRRPWVIDSSTPVFTRERHYIEELVEPKYV